MSEASTIALVGIFWGIPENGKFILAIDTTPTAEAERYGEFLTHPRGHYEVWEQWKSLGPVRLKKQGLPIRILSSEYEEFPRGRVVFHEPSQIYTVYMDRKLNQIDSVKALIFRFGLTGLRSEIRSDPHYVS